MLDERKRLILQAIIEDFIATAEPIGSRTIARKMNMTVSAATIRNEMADLEHLGFLEQPHTSAGRIPSAKGYRFYVDWLMAPIALSDKEIALIKKWYSDRTRQLTDIFQETVRILAHLTHNVSLMVTKKDVPVLFNYLKYLPLDKNRAVMIIMGQNGVIEDRVVEIGRSITAEDLQRAAMLINDQYSGRLLRDISLADAGGLCSLQPADSAVLDLFLKVVRSIVQRISTEQLYLGGTTQLLSQPEFREMERVRNLLNMLEEQRLMFDILHSKANQGTVITIGHENKFSGISDCSIVQADFRLDEYTTGKIAVLGPTRMHYGKVISTMDFMTKYMPELIKRYVA